MLLVATVEAVGTGCKRWNGGCVTVPPPVTTPPDDVVDDVDS
jgi:hypothetical protein